MKKDLLINHLLNKSSRSIAELKKLKESYPYFSMARILYLKELKGENEKLFQEEIKSNAVFISNRKQLFHLLNNFERSDIANSIQADTEKMIKLHSANNNLLDFSGTDVSTTDFKETVSEDTRKENTESETKRELTQENSPSFTDWLDTVEIKNTEKDKFALIDRFVTEDVGAIRADKKTMLQGDISKKSTEEDESFITDTLARIYIKQGLYSKAIYAYEKLSLKYPEKSIYFASQIEEIKKVTNK
jgi:hypothetical protein